MSHPRPRVVISRCIDFDSCRYNGQVIRASVRDELEPHVDFLPICPELEIGLGVPRDPVRLTRKDGTVHMVQPATGSDLTARMESFSRKFLSGLGEADAFILKARSPSCGVRNAKVFHGEAGDASFDSGPGLFAGRVLERFPHAAVEDEARLKDLRLRHHFLTKSFALAGLRAAARTGVPGLLEFHARSKLLLMAHSEAHLRRMGRLLGDSARRPSAEVVREYSEQFAAALARPSRPGANVNVLMHALGHVSERLAPRERTHFLELLESYRGRAVPLSAPQAVVASWAARFEVEYLAGQTFLEPYPAPLVRFERVTKRQRRSLRELNTASP
jgi:uncharacterized protein YbgA (DUF1722 family)/uncharacterized protein YbbK (DUF523 family)